MGAYELEAQGGFHWGSHFDELDTSEVWEFLFEDDNLSLGNANIELMNDNTGQQQEKVFCLSGFRDMFRGILKTPCD